MMKSLFHKKEIIGISIGVIITIILLIAGNYLSFLYELYLEKTLSIGQFKNLLQHPNAQFISMSILFQLLPYILYLIGGFITGIILKKNGWFYGGSVGLVLTVLGFIISIITLVVLFILPASALFGRNTGDITNIKNIQLQSFYLSLIDFPRFVFAPSILLPALGGWIGSKIKNYHANIHKTN